MTTLREAAQMALEAMEERDAVIRWAVDQEDTHFSRTVACAIEAALRSKNHE